MSLFSGLDGKTIMSLFLRVGQLLCTLLPIWLTSRDTLKVGVINWCLYIWCICFGLTFLGFLLELGSLFKLPLCNIRSLLRLSDKFQYHLPLSWDGVLHAFGSYFAVFCLSAAVIFGPTYIQFFSPGPARNRVITATACSCVAALLYAIEVAWVCRRPSRVSCFWPTFPGVLRRLENYVANIIFAFISNTDLSLHQPALVWCVAVYLICFLLGAVNYLVNGCDCDNDKKLPLRLPVLLWVQTVLSVLLYATAVILWPLYQFQEKLGEQPQRSSDMSCSDQLNIFVCVWDQRLAVAILTVINLLVYVADLVYLVREAFMAAPSRDGCRAERPGHMCLQGLWKEVVALKACPASLGSHPRALLMCGL
ncbi:myeloid-associated differentiation marker-like [Ovis aries]|uniref:myeloid-associated differentiation marker-like n=1 Tax=Ovis aries TaxID=9940 RepID=UPI00029D5A65|nr:myeloid-associated differentiation marker-like [Ovis aries]